MKHALYFLIFFIICSVAAVAFAGNETVPRATAEAYFDIATGHKYIQNHDQTYAEYSKRGKLLRARLSAAMPLLVSGKYIREIGPDNYLVYTKDRDRTIQPALTAHPYGWKCEKMVSLVPGADPSEPEAYEPAR